MLMSERRSGCCCRNNIHTVICGYVTKLSSDDWNGQDGLLQTSFYYRVVTRVSGNIKPRANFM